MAACKEDHYSRSAAPLQPALQIQEGKQLFAIPCGRLKPPAEKDRACPRCTGELLTPWATVPAGVLPGLPLLLEPRLARAPWFRTSQIVVAAVDIGLAVGLAVALARRHEAFGRADAVKDTVAEDDEETYRVQVIALGATLGAVALGNMIITGVAHRRARKELGLSAAAFPTRGGAGFALGFAW